jgi:hypothetical protein
VAKIDVDQLEANRQVTLRLEDCVEHGFVPGSIDVVDVYELTARNVSHYEAPFEHFPDHVVDLVEVGETDGVMFIEADVPTFFASSARRSRWSSSPQNVAESPRGSTKRSSA